MLTPSRLVRTVIYNDDLSSSKIELDFGSGAKSGALDSDSERAYKHAELMYKTFRNIKSDVPNIAKATGYSEKEISDIKDYIFNNNEFVPDYDQAQTWDRLRKGHPVEADIVFLQHELMEMEYRKQGYSYDEAHQMTQQVYNYDKAVKEYKGGSNKKKGDNG